MRKIRIFEHISLDGVIQLPGGQVEAYQHGDWTGAYRNPAGAEVVAQLQGTGFDLLLGRRTYDIWSGYWPIAPSSPIADSLNTATKYIATHRPDSLEWGPVKDLGTDIMEDVRSIKSENGPDLILWGSSTLTTELLQHGLVDEVVLFVYPVLLGQGKRFFSASADPRELALVSSRALHTGVLVNTYRYVGELRT